MKKALVMLLTCLPIWLYGQNDVQISQQFSRIHYNPAATGASNYMNMFLLARQQWVGFKDAPSTQLFNIHNYVDGINSGLGLSLINDKLGALESSINAKIAYAYHIHFDNTSYLSFGLSGGVLYKKLDYEKAILENPNDPSLATYADKNTKVNPDFDFGIEYNLKRWQFGVSTTHLTNVSKSMNKLNNLQSSRHIYGYLHYNWEANRNWRIVPNGLVSYNSGDFSFRINTMAYFKERFWFGAAYRFNQELKSEAVVGIAGLFVTDFLRLGYAYDYNTGAIKSYTSGTHEIMLSLRLSKGDGNYGRKTPRFFE